MCSFYSVIGYGVLKARVDHLNIMRIKSFLTCVCLRYYISSSVIENFYKYFVSIWIFFSYYSIQKHKSEVKAKIIFWEIRTNF